MSVFERNFPLRKKDMEEMEQQAWLIYEDLYDILQKLANEKYNATVNDLVVCAIGHLLETENVHVFSMDSRSTFKRSFRIPRVYNQGLAKLKQTYDISKNKLINIAIYNAIQEENL